MIHTILLAPTRLKVEKIEIPTTALRSLCIDNMDNGHLSNSPIIKQLKLSAVCAGVLKLLPHHNALMFRPHLHSHLILYSPSLGSRAAGLSLLQLYVPSP